jgi:ATP-dependent Clp protease ATP-binding subunit ClpA
MYERFAHESRIAVERALDIARRLGAEQLEPEHLLLALAEGDADPAARALAEAGLDGGAIDVAIEQDLVAALEVVGVPASVVASTPAHPRADRPGFGLPARHALERALAAAVGLGARRLGTGHLLLGLLDPPAVSVWRLLVALDVQPERLAALVQVEIGRTALIACSRDAVRRPRLRRRAR